MLNTLIGFYIAALAAIAAFPNKLLDEPMKGQGPTIGRWHQGARIDERVSRRRFLVILFGYCAFLAIAIFGVGVVSTMGAPSIATAKWMAGYRVVWLAVYFAMSASLLVATLLGLHYLIDRMHRH